MKLSDLTTLRIGGEAERFVDATETDELVETVLEADRVGEPWLVLGGGSNVLIGDDGQHDEELYRAFVDSHPENVAAVAIRQLSTPEAVLAGGRRHIDAPEGAAPWVWAPDGAGLAKKLAEVGILRRYR